MEKNLRDLAVLAEKEHQQQEDGEEAFVDNVIMYEILSELKDIAARPDGITCACGADGTVWRSARSAVDLICRDCGAKLRIPAATDRDLDDLCCHMKLVIPESGTDPLHRSGHGTEKRTLAQNHAAAGQLFPGRRCPAGYRHRGRGPMERKEPALISLLARLFYQTGPGREEPETRRAYGVLCWDCGHLPERAAVRRKVSGGHPLRVHRHHGGRLQQPVGRRVLLRDTGGGFSWRGRSRTQNTPSATGGWVRLRPGGIGPDPADGPGAGEDVH